MLGGNMPSPEDKVRRAKGKKGQGKALEASGNLEGASLACPVLGC